MSKVSKMVFAAFTQHCIQSTVTHLTHVEDVEDAKYYCTVLCIIDKLAKCSQTMSCAQFEVSKRLVYRHILKSIVKNLEEKN